MFYRLASPMAGAGQNEILQVPGSTRNFSATDLCCRARFPADCFFYLMKIRGRSHPEINVRQYVQRRCRLAGSEG